MSHYLKQSIPADSIDDSLQKRRHAIATSPSLSIRVIGQRTRQEFETTAQGKSEAAHYYKIDICTVQLSLLAAETVEAFVCSRGYLLETLFWIVCWVWVTCRRAIKTRPGSRQPNRSITNKGWPKQNRLLVCWRGLLLETFLLWRFGSSGLAWAFLLPKPQ